MKTLCSVIAALFLCIGTVQASETVKQSSAPAEKKALSASQQRMVDCNKEASGKKGDDRKTFMRTCMQADKAGGKQQNRMKECNVKASGMKGDERKTFMSQCLSNKQD